MWLEYKNYFLIIPTSISLCVCVCVCALYVRVCLILFPRCLGQKLRITCPGSSVSRDRAPLVCVCVCIKSLSGELTLWPAAVFQQTLTVNSQSLKVPAEDSSWQEVRTTTRLTDECRAQVKGESADDLFLRLFFCCGILSGAAVCARVCGDVKYRGWMLCGEKSFN